MAPLFAMPSDLQLSGKERMLYRRLNENFTPELLEVTLLPFLDQTSPISLRALDWAVVNWSKQHNIVCSSRTPGEVVNVYHAYRRALAFWKRRLFDPFRRRMRCTVTIKDKQYETTLGQANFVFFAYQTGILAYVIGHIDAIESDMNTVALRQKQLKVRSKKEGALCPRQELTTASNVKCVAYVSPSHVEFL